ncbi:MAG: ABC transporter substrate-binding protein [Spirochaetaceae bacterium]|jgi:hypothetical protein|nr:ABC transporter substrate-binding protein [Spirochaetaceae bacterium]
MRKLLLLALLAIAAQLSAEQLVVVSTTWVGAIARAGGATNIRVLAPAEMKHPAEYEMSPQDILAAGKAALIIYSGWEGFAERLAETAGEGKIKTLTVECTNSPAILVREARKVAAALGTEAACEKWAASFNTFVAGLKKKVNAVYPEGSLAAIQRMQSPVAEWTGWELLEQYGPGEPSPALLLKIINAKPAIIIDNWHGPSGAGLAESLPGAKYFQFINFPGKDGTKTLEDVFQYNADLLLEGR